eukprot:m.2012 g.2012  ORF g.2012 m.2012 type:complete len:232 (+) comp1431_c0_seq1:159-854(+)
MPKNSTPDRRARTKRWRAVGLTGDGSSEFGGGCSYCRRADHSIASCLTRLNDMAEGRVPLESWTCPRNLEGKFLNLRRNDKWQAAKVVPAVSLGFSATSPDNVDGSVKFAVFSTASHHMVSEDIPLSRSWPVSMTLKPVTGPPFTATRQGDCPLNLGKCDILLQDVLVHSKLYCNILSATRLVEKGHSVSFDIDSGAIHFSNGVDIPLSCEGGLFCFRARLGFSDSREPPC